MHLGGSQRRRNIKHSSAIVISSTDMQRNRSSSPRLVCDNTEYS
jgi:hypothetical protein